MSLAIDKSQVKAWLDHSSKMLERAREMCTEAQSLLLSTSYQIETYLPERLRFCKFMNDKLTNQQKVLSRTVESIRKETELELTRFSDKINEVLVPALEHLNNIVLQLQYTKIPSFVVEESFQLEVQNKSSKSYISLGDFISVDALALLKTNIEIYETNAQKLHQMLRLNLNDILINPFQRTITKQYSKVIKQYDEKLPMQFGMKVTSAGPVVESNNTINTLLKENQSLEQELAAILAMLTNHYDQCVRGLSLMEGNANYTPVDLEVLQNDALELPEVMKELNTVYNVILKNESRAKLYLEAAIPHADNIIELSKHLFESYKEFRNKHIAKFLVLSMKAKERFSDCSIEGEPEKDPIDIYSETINQLSYHYGQFLEVYKSNYLHELHYEKYVYPRKFIKKLADFLDDGLYQFQEEERDRRKKWLTKYGDFIPKEFKLPGEYNQPMVVQVVTDGLDDIEQKDVSQEDDEEMMLLKLISSNK